MSHYGRKTVRPTAKCRPGDKSYFARIGKLGQAALAAKKKQGRKPPLPIA